MKIYKLDVDVSKPVRQVVKMQQNATGVLSVHVQNDAKYIRNLSCELYDGDAKLSSISVADDWAAFQLDVGDSPKAVKFVAHAQPYECSAEYVLSSGGSGGVKNVFLERLQLKAGTYNQDEFQPLTKLGNNDGYVTTLVPTAATQSHINFTRIKITPWNQQKQIWFQDANGDIPEDTLIVVTEDAVIGMNQAVKGRTYALSAVTYPAVGYYSDYALETVIQPDTNAHCYAERDVVEPTTEPEETIEE